MRWNKKQLLGFSVKSMEELTRAISIGANLVEIKLERFASSGTPLYQYLNGKFIPNKKNLKKLKKLTRKVQVQFHLPIESCVSHESENGFNICEQEHHMILIKRFSMFEWIYRKYGLGKILTMHPPLISADGKDFFTEAEALTKGKIFFDKLDLHRRKNKHKSVIAMENMTDAKTKAGNLGFLSRHFKKILEDTRTIGLTVDVGHRRLTSEFRVRDFIALGIPIVNCHFHGNTGKFNPDNWDDDQHLLPDAGNVYGYDNYLRYFRRHRIPVVLEISHLENYTDKELKIFVKKFKKELKG